MWSSSGNKGQKWNYGNVLVGDNKNFTVVFESTAGDSGTSDIAIDDVSFTPECSTGCKSGFSMNGATFTNYEF